MKNSVEEKVKLVKNFKKIAGMCFGSFIFTILLTIITSVITGFVVLKIFLYAMILASAIFTIITFITTCVTLYFKVTTLDEDKSKNVISEIVTDIENM